MIEEEFLKVPWGDLAAFVGFLIGILTLIGLVGVRFQRFRDWLGPKIQDMLGVTSLGNKMDTYMEVQGRANADRDAAIKKAGDDITATQNQIQALGKIVNTHVRARSKHLSAKKGTGTT